MACGGCAQRGRALRDASVALRGGDVAQARRDIGVVMRSLSEDAKAFAEALRVRLRGG